MQRETAAILLRIRRHTVYRGGDCGKAVRNWYGGHCIRFGLLSGQLERVAGAFRFGALRLLITHRLDTLMA